MERKTAPKSLKLNMVLNAIKGLMGVIFPLITFPYVSRVLGVDVLGRYSFSNSVISYFTLFSALGISTYAIREGARIRDSKPAFQDFANQMFTINMISTIISYLLIFICLLIIPKLASYWDLILVLSIQMIFRTIGIEWVYSIYEDYTYITIRSIAFQLISLVLLFLLVKTPQDVRLYAGITTFSAVGSNILNYIHSRNTYVSVCFTKSVDWKIHIKPIMVLFAMSLTISIYVSSDTVILGFLCDDHTVGIYSVSVKIYTIIKTLLSSVLVVSIPRLSAILGQKNMEEFDHTAGDIYKTLLTLVAPAITGIIVLREQIVSIISTSDYLNASSSLALLGIALFFCMGAWFWGQCVMVPFKQDTQIFRITVISALINIVLNFALIPIWKENAAALTTILAEGFAFVMCRRYGMQKTKLTGVASTIWKILIGCVAVAGIAILFKMIIDNQLLYTIVTIIVSVIVYFVVEIVLRNDAATTTIDQVLRKIQLKH